MEIFFQIRKVYGNWIKCKPQMSPPMLLYLIFGWPWNPIVNYLVVIGLNSLRKYVCIYRINEIWPVHGSVPLLLWFHGHSKLKVPVPLGAFNTVEVRICNYCSSKNLERKENISVSGHRELTHQTSCQHLSQRTKRYTFPLIGSIILKLLISCDGSTS